MIVKLEGNADYLRPGPRRQSSNGRAIDATGHGNDDPRLRRGALEIEINRHGRLFTRSSPITARRLERIGGESHLSRFERDFEAAGDAPPGAVPIDQREAIACYLSVGEGWSEAMKRLRGAFASE